MTELERREAYSRREQQWHPPTHDDTTTTRHRDARASERRRANNDRERESRGRGTGGRCQRRGISSARATVRSKAKVSQRLMDALRCDRPYVAASSAPFLHSPLSLACSRVLISRLPYCALCCCSCWWWWRRIC